MLLPNIYISITNPATNQKVEFDYVTEFTAKRSWKMLTATGRLTIPRKLKLQGKNLVEYLKPGFEVFVACGYNGEYAIEYEGYISRIEPHIPAVIHLEDEMWKLKQNSLKLSYRGVSLSQLVSDIAPGYETKTIDAQLGPFRINNVSTAKVLEELKKQYGLHAWFERKKLYVCLPYQMAEDWYGQFFFERNMIETNSLQYKTKNEAKVRVRAISMFADNSKFEVKVGDDSGEEHTLHYYKLSKAELTNRAKADLDKLKYDGYRGSFKTFGFPFVIPNWKAELISEEYPERSGIFFIDETEVSFGMGGYKRTIRLGGAAK